MSKLYVDGCSYTYGHGLPREYSLGNLLGADIDLSRPAKSNIAMVEDLYKSIDMYDTFIIGFTLSTRFSFYYSDKTIDLTPTTSQINFGDYSSAERDEEEFIKFAKSFYKFSSINSLKLMTDFIIDSTVALLEQQNKKFVILSWERQPRINGSKIFYPRKHISSTYNISATDNHLSANGMTELAKLIKNIL